ncbi:MAG: hypothetical protein MI824_08405 [Hyphomicrobiales bacterium]|nr:hypothetical protein [Hyphomicrobiales bacterium]
MSVDLPDFLKSGEIARLIPVASASQKERHAASVLLATLSIVRPLARDLFATIGRRVGTTTAVDAYTEVVFHNQNGERSARPDGLLILKTSRTEWRALIEAKIGNAKIDVEQIEAYARLARENAIDTIITISNELTVIPEQTPYALPSGIGRRVAVYHWSWMKLITVATLLIAREDQFDEEQHYILKEMVRYLSHENIGVKGFHRMCSDWKPLLSKVHAGATVQKNDIDVVNTIKCWHQEQQDICLILSRHLRAPVSLRLKRSHRDDQSMRIADDAQALAETKRLMAAFEVPNLAGPMEVVADLRRRNIVCRMQVAAPEDRKRYASRLNWLLRQLPDDLDRSAVVRVYWKGGGETYASVPELRDDVKVADIERPGAVPRSFEVAVISDLERKFFGPQSFIEGLEAAVPQFYDSVAKHIREWRAMPPEGPAVQVDENLTEPFDRARVVRRNPDRVAHKGSIDGRVYSIFEDGSIEVETPRGVKWFRDLAALQSFAAASS